MVDTHNRQRLRRRNVELPDSLVVNVMLQRVEQHRANIPRTRLQKITEEHQIILHVTQRAGVWNVTKQRRQTIRKLEVLRATMPIFLAVRSFAASLPPNP